MKIRNSKGPKPVTIVLSERQEQILQKMSNSRQSAHSVVERSRIILNSAAGFRNQQIADEMGISVPTVRKWRNRWSEASEKLSEKDKELEDKEFEESIRECLSDAKRPGIKPKFSAEQICQIIAIACEDPKESDRPVSHWTPQELRQEAIKREVVKEISVRHTGRFLKRSRPKTAS